MNPDTARTVYLFDQGPFYLQAVVSKRSRRPMQRKQGGLDSVRGTGGGWFRETAGFLLDHRGKCENAIRLIR